MENLNYQNEVIDFIKDLPYHGIFLEYGMGKTRCVLEFMKYNGINKALIMSRKNMILESINKDMGLHRLIKEHSNFSAISLVGSQVQKLNILKNTNADIYLCTYDTLKNKKVFKALISKKFEYLIADESANIKNLRIDRTKKVLKLAHHIKHRAALTDFPVSESIINIYSQIQFLALNDNPLGATFWSFLKKYFYKGYFTWRPKPDAMQQIMEAIAPFCICKKIRGTLNLPPRKKNNIIVCPTLNQAKMFKQAQEEFEISIGDETISMQNFLPIITKLRQIASGFLIIDRGIKLFHTRKDFALKSLIKDILPEKMIVWCEFAHELNKLSYILRAFEPLVISSKNKSTDTTDKISNFKKDSSHRILVCNTNFMEAGETLTCARHSIFYSHGWSWGKRSNAEHRIFRKGAEIHKSIVYHNIYVKGSIEEEIIKRQSKKKSIVQVLKNYLENKK